jgi:rhamnose transport system permease protein
VSASRLVRSREFGLAIVLLGILVFFAAWTPVFRSPAKVLDQSRYWMEIGVMAGVSFGIVVAGGIDLSIASVLALCGVCLSRLHFEVGLPIELAALAAMAIGAVAGLINGALIAFGRIPDLVATLATLVMYRGITQWVVGNRVYSGFPERYLWLSDGVLLGVVPVPWAVLGATWAAAYVVFHRSRLGRYAYAMGASFAAARSAGVPVRPARLVLYAASGLAASVGAILYTARNNTAKSDDAEGYELDVLTCVFLGGTSMSGGRGTLLGTVLGVLIVGCLRTGMLFLDASPSHRRIVLGAILILSAAWNEWLSARRARRAGRDRFHREEDSDTMRRAPPPGSQPRTTGEVDR